MLKKIIQRCIFPLEFIISLLFAFTLLRYVCIKHYYGIHSLKHIIYIIIFALTIILLIIYNVIKNRKRIEKIVICFLIPIGTLYLFFMIPSQVPDEQVHLARAYEVSEGVLIGNKDLTSNVPRDLANNIKPNMESYQKLYKALEEKTDYNYKVTVSNPAATYPFILYAFSAIGFIIAKAFSLNILIGCYLAKIMNFIVFLIATYYTLKIIPFGKLAITAIVFMPMFLHQVTSTSADCIVNILVMIFIAYLFYLCFREKELNKKDGILLVILGVLLAIVKYVYLPIVLMSLILINSKNLSKKYKIILISTLIILSSISAIVYYMYSTTYHGNVYSGYLEENHVSVFAQLNGIIRNPVSFLYVLFNTIRSMGKMYICQMIGSSLGWLCISVPRYSIIIYAIVLIISCFLEKNENSLNGIQKLLGIIVSIISSVLVMLGMYLTWTGVGKNIVEGVQGRYFIPIIFVALLSIVKKDNNIKIKNIEYILPIILCILNLPALNAIYNFFI